MKCSSASGQSIIHPLEPKPEPLGQRRDRNCQQRQENQAGSQGAAPEEPAFQAVLFAIHPAAHLLSIILPGRLPYFAANRYTVVV